MHVGSLECINVYVVIAILKLGTFGVCINMVKITVHATEIRNYYGYTEIHVNNVIGITNPTSTIAM